ncbi:putative RND superfamily exporter protein [Rubricella aquisinus]|uniref:Putative RND superfamily exporter protein n=1 Tax=Rubricella aquisinus TaxID=2028108 RepID=A0A840WX46_9RHOB|nr:hypothetical protein [Rubricella aquisinus]MBB5514266.1 putative RND superfamily exporter protein [Rubricella aquisinus]
MIRLGARIAAILCLTLLSAIMLPSLRVEGDMTSAIARAAPLDGSDAARVLDRWQDPTVTLLATWRGEGHDGFIAALSDLVFELSFAPGVAQVISPFTIEQDGRAPLVLAAEGMMEAAPALRAAREATRFGPFLIGEDLKSTLLFVQGDRQALDALPDQFTRCPAEAALCLRPIGPVAAEQVIERQLARDNLLLPLITAAVSTGIVVLWFGSLRIAVLLMLPPGIGVVWYLALIAALGMPLDVFNTLVPTILLTLGLADMLHLRRAADTAEDGRRALRAVLPAITVTTGTTALAFASLALEGSVAMERLAICGGVGMVTLWLAVVIIGPICVPARGPRKGPTGPRRRMIAALHRFQRRMARQGALLRPAALGLAALGMGVALSVPADFTFEENLPAGAVADAVEDGIAAGLSMAPLFAIIPAADAAAEQRALSLLYGAGDGAATEDLSNARLSGGRIALPYPIALGASARDIRAEAAALRARLAPMGDITLLGYPLRVADTITRAIARLQLVLVVGVLAQALILTAMLRSGRAGMASLLPNILPLLAIQVAMALSVGWVNVSAAVAMIVASGIVVDDTAHLLWASRAGRGRLAIGRGLRKTMEPITLTTVTLIAGLSVLGLSGLPGLQTFGALMVVALCIAWIGDLILLPAFLRWRTGR